MFCKRYCRSYNVQRVPINPDTLFLSTLDEVDLDNIMTTRSLEDLTFRQHRNQAPLPPIPPKPTPIYKSALSKSVSASESALYATALTRGYNNFTVEAPEGEYPRDDSPIPPPVPVRSKSREHFYHTLECTSNTADSGVVLTSPVYSQQSGSPTPPVPPRSSSALERGEEPETEQQLFDDPRYVALTVEEGEEGEEGEGLEAGNLRGRKEMWRSTPALATTELPKYQGRGRRNRRSLRVAQVVGTHIYD